MARRQEVAGCDFDCFQYVYLGIEQLVHQFGLILLMVFGFKFGGISVIQDMMFKYKTYKAIHSYQPIEKKGASGLMADSVVVMWIFFYTSTLGFGMNIDIPNWFSEVWNQEYADDASELLRQLVHAVSSAEN